MIFRVGFKEKRNDDQGQRAVFSIPYFQLLQPCRANARVKNGLQVLPGGGIGKNNLCQKIATKRTISGKNIIAKTSTNFTHGRLAGLDQLTG